jgi:hypothetical protein
MKHAFIIINILEIVKQIFYFEKNNIEILLKLISSELS